MVGYGRVFFEGRSLVGKGNSGTLPGRTATPVKLRNVPLDKLSKLSLLSSSF
jgi:hypothetical protein